MGRMKDALLMTVGTGVGKDKEKARGGLAYAMLKSIDFVNPDVVKLFGSEESKYTLEALKKLYFKRHKREFDYYEFIQIDEIDDFNKYFNSIKNVVLELEDEYKIIIDYTYGTKTMTMSAAMVSMLYGQDLIFITGERKDGIVQKGTEKIINQNLYPIYDEFSLDNIKRSFNANRFETARELLSNVVEDNADKEAFSKLIESYYYFDNVNYVEAYKYFDVDLFTNTWPELKMQFGLNRRALHNIVKEDKTKDYYLLASLINNARRRSEEHKYDDAIARLYRSLELIGQIYLEKYDLNSSNIDIEILIEKGVEDCYIQRLENSRSDDGKIRIGLIQDFEVLSYLDSNIKELYDKQKNKIKNIVTYRNSSILAHGMEAKTEEEYVEFESLLFDIISILEEKVLEYIEETKFPVFE